MNENIKLREKHLNPQFLLWGTEHSYHGASRGIWHSFLSHPRAPSFLTKFLLRVFAKETPGVHGYALVIYPSGGKPGFIKHFLQAFLHLDFAGLNKAHQLCTKFTKFPQVKPW